MPSIGELDRRISIERLESGFIYDEFGNPFPSTIWEELATVWASRADVSDTERLAGGGIISELVSRFVIRAVGPQASVRPSDRLAYNGATWNIMGVKETKDGRSRFLEITAKKGR